MHQGVRNNWRGSPYHLIIQALQTGTPFIWEIFRIGYCIRGNYSSDKYFIFKWSTRLQSMYNHMVGRSASIISPFYSLLLVIQKVHCNRNYNNNKKFFVQSRCIFRLNVFKDSWFYILLAPSSNGQIKLGEYVRVLHIAACWQQAPMVRLN